MPVPAYIAELRRSVGHAELFVPTVVVVVRDAAGRVLLVHDRESGLWTPPGGILEPGERPADGALREVWEEAGVTVRLTKLAGVFGGPGCVTHYRNGDRLAWLAVVFAAEWVAGQPAGDGDETRDARWFDAGELASLPLKPEARIFIEAAAQSASGPQFLAPIWSPP